MFPLPQCLDTCPVQTRTSSTRRFIPLAATDRPVAKSGANGETRTLQTAAYETELLIPSALAKMYQPESTPRVIRSQRHGSSHNCVSVSLLQTLSPF